MNFAEIGESIIKAIEPFPCRCGGTFNKLCTKGDRLPLVVVYKCSNCKRETEQTMDVPSLDELTPEQKAEINKLGVNNVLVEILKWNRDERKDNL